MKVAFDLDAALRNPFSGFYTFGKGLLEGMDGVANPPDMLLFYQRRYGKRAGDIISGLGKWAIPLQVNFKFRWLQALWDISPFPDPSFFMGDYDIFHSFHNFIPSSGRRPAILTVHDLRRYVLPDLYKRSRLKRFECAIKRADHFIAVSQATKNDLVRHFHIPEEMVDVVHLGCSHGKIQMTAEEKAVLRKRLLSEHGIDVESYFITISSGDPRKNIGRTVEAFRTVSSNFNQKTGLVIVGKLPEGFDTPQDKNIFCTGSVDDVMPWLCCSKGLIFVSLYEGFGLPVLEAFAASVPVITSNCSSMPEVAGKAAILVDPWDAEEIAEAVNELASSKERRDEIIRAGRRRLKDFSWTATAKKTVEVYEKVLNRV